jgi:transcription antitermination factor NusG
MRRHLSDEGEALSANSSGITQLRPSTHSASSNAPDFSRWYAIYTCSRHEKKVAEHLKVLDIDHFLPLFTEVRDWKNGKASIEAPLFPAYVFARVDLRNRVKLLRIPSVVRLVGCRNEPAPISDSEIETLRIGLKHYKFEPHPYLKVGDKVRVIRGALEGLEGVLSRKSGLARVVVNVESIMRAVSLQIDGSDLEPI